MLVTLDRLQILVLHGPTLNLRGRREPHIYDALTMEDINQRLRLLAAELGVDLELVQCVGVSFSLSPYHPITL